MKKVVVINMKVKINKNRFVNLVTVVDPFVTPELVNSMCGLNGKIVNAEVSKEMPLTMAMAESRKLKIRLGII